MSYNFLKNIVIAERSTLTVARGNSKTPEGLTLRVYRNGRVYPSKELTERFDLEYRVENEALAGNGIDFFEAANWGAYPKNLPNVLFVAFVPKALPKVDLFNTRRNAEVSVLNQAPVNLELWKSIVSIHPEVQNNVFCDLVIDTTTPVQTADGIYLLPKQISRGANKGEVQWVRRENITLFPASPAQETLDEVNVIQDDVVVTLNSPNITT